MPIKTQRFTDKGFKSSTTNRKSFTLEIKNFSRNTAITFGSATVQIVMNNWLQFAVLVFMTGNFKVKRLLSFQV